jgi:uracil-DNA glycosylase
MEYDYNQIIKRVHKAWLPFFKEHDNEFKHILNVLNDDLNKNKIIYPLPKDLLKTFFYIGPQEIKLVLIGQDPYTGFEIHNKNKIPQACGMAFSVPKRHKKIPGSLINIFKEIKNCYPNTVLPTHGYLKRWVKKEKILLLNSALTVISNNPNSHLELWTNFVDDIIKYINNVNHKVIYLLMGNFAINKSKLISDKYKIFTSVHPSPQSAYNGFFGSKIFLHINKYLESRNIKPIKWLKILKK